MRHLILAGLGSLLAFASVSRADVLAYSSLPNQAPNQSYGSSFGMDFVPTTNVSVTELGLYSGLLGGGTGTGFAGDDFATLFDSSGNVLAQLEFGNGTGNGTLVAGTSDYVKSLSTPVTLTVGNTYTIAAYYTGGVDQLANASQPPPAETGAPVISYVGSGRYAQNGTPNTYPTTIDGGPANRYNGPTFAFTPEPASIGLIGLGGLGLLARRRRA